jgi:hypothetical protein
VLFNVAVRVILVSTGDVFKGFTNQMLLVMQAERQASVIGRTISDAKRRQQANFMFRNIPKAWKRTSCGKRAQSVPSFFPKMGLYGKEENPR